MSYRLGPLDITGSVVIISGSIESVPVAGQTTADVGPFTVSGSTITTTGSLIVSGTIQGNFVGSILTASYVQVAQTASYVVLAQSASHAVTADTALYVDSTNVEGPYGMDSITSASYALTASYVLNGGGGGSVDTSSLATTGSNTFIGNQTISGSIIFGNNGLIESIPTSSGDGLNASTLELKPDASLGTDQYIILDPTSPNHIHIRAGGEIDNSASDLILGGEHTNVLVSDITQGVQITTTNTEVEFIGYIDDGFGGSPGATLHVTNIINGTITDGMTIYGPGIPGGYTLQFGTVMAPQGDGGTGNYYLPGGNFLTDPSTYTNGVLTYNNWNFDVNGNTLFPTLTTPRGDISGGDLITNTLRLGNGSNQVVIGTPNGTNSSPNSQRLVINPGQGSGSYEGGDIYLWAGRGGVDGGSGGDIKIRGGYGPVTGNGGYVRIEGGNTADGTAGFVEIRGGDSNTSEGGDVNIYGGYGNGNTQNGSVTINTYDSSGATKTWTFDTSGSLATPGNLTVTGSVDITGSLLLNGAEVKPYKTYTTLLSQTGNGTSTQTSGLLEVGKRYAITTYVAGDDFSNVANVVSGVINTDGCEFIATGTTPTDYTNGSTLTDTAAPIATVLENGLGGTPVWSRIYTGTYVCTLTDAFPNNKTFCSITYGYDWGNLGHIYFGKSTGTDTLIMYFYDYNGAPSEIMNGPNGNDIYVEVRVYN